MAKPTDVNPQIRDPLTIEEWQAAADAAAFCLLLHSAWVYGLVDVDGDEINVLRCEYILKRARAFGITPKQIA